MNHNSNRLVVLAFIVPVVLVFASWGYIACRAINAGEPCEMYRYTPQKDVPVTCAEYLKAHPQRPY